MSNADTSDHIRHLTVLASNSPRETREALEAAVEALRSPRLVSCGDCAHCETETGHLAGPFQCGQSGGRELPFDDVVPSWCPLRPKK